jgi:Leucine-rich repeat (LRR) protein
MQHLIPLIFSIYFTQLIIVNQSSKIIHSNEEMTFQNRSRLDCSLYDSDYDILASFPFRVDINNSDNIYSTYAYGFVENEINRIVIRNEIVLPLTFFCLKHLTYFGIFDSHIIPFFSDNDADYLFPSEIERLASLVSIVIMNTKITQLPEEFSKLKHLGSLEMHNTGLINLPETFGNLPSLGFLRLNNNNFVSLPKTISNIESFNMVILDENRHLRSLQSFNGIRNLKHLYARSCVIDRIPYNVPDLYYLLLSNNSITNLYGIETLGYNTNENKTFVFRSNRIKSIPPEIRYVRNLNTLDLSNNQLTFLPMEIFQIDTLVSLDITNNSFSTKELNRIIQTFKKIHPHLKLYY